jgi:hypothetical protein
VWVPKLESIRVRGADASHSRKSWTPGSMVFNGRIIVRSGRLSINLPVRCCQREVEDLPPNVSLNPLRRLTASPFSFPHTP